MRVGAMAKWILVVLVLVFAASAAAETVFVYKKPKAAHPGREATPLEAYRLMQQDPEHSYIVDVRTRPEYQFVGHPVQSILIPFLMWGNEFKDGEYKLRENPAFIQEIMKRFDSQTDTLFFLCRSGTRAAMALGAAVKAGWPAERSYVILGGFEGDKLKDPNSAYNGQRVGGGWRNEGLPWTYTMDPTRIY